MSGSVSAHTVGQPGTRTLPPSGEPIPFARLVAVEVRKAVDTRASRWLIGIILGLVALACVIAIIVNAAHGDSAAWGDFTSAAAFITSFLLPVLGIMVVTQEWGQRTAMVTFGLEPRRARVVIAKWVVGVILTLVTVVFSIVFGAICTAVLGAVSSGGSSWDFGLSDLLGFVVTQLLAMTGGFALAALLLNTAGAVVLFFAYKWVIPTLLIIGSNQIEWFSHVAPWIDFLSAQDPFYDGWDFTASDVAHLVTSGLLWVALPLVLGIVRIMRAEVK